MDSQSIAEELLFELKSFWGEQTTFNQIEEDGTI